MLFLGVFQSQPRHDVAVGMETAVSGGPTSGHVARQLRKRHEDHPRVCAQVLRLRTSKCFVVIVLSQNMEDRFHIYGNLK